MFLLDPAEMKGVVDALQADLRAQQALAGSSSAAAGQFQVDLGVLYKHHADVVAVYDSLGKQVQKLSSEAGANYYPASEITGVQKSLEATWGAVIDGSTGNMLRGLTSVMNMIGDYANAVADVYRSYINADSTGSAELTAAGNPGAARYTIPTS